jgi:GNAT superfamily N-acetyltransferase
MVKKTSFALEDLKSRVLSPSEIEELHRHITPDIFEVLVSGESITKPKIIIDPSNKVGYRLVPEDPAHPSYAKPRYEPFEIKDQPSNHFILDGDKLDRHHQEVKLPEGYSIKNFKVMMDVYPRDEIGKTKVLPEGYLSRAQFYALHSACSTTSGWWPLDTFSRPNKARYEVSDIAVLFENEKPVGYYMTRGSTNDEKPWLLNHIALLPSYRGSGLGSVLLEHALHACISKKRKAVELHTTDNDLMVKSDGSHKSPARTFYEKKGFEFCGSDVVTKEQFLTSYLGFLNPEVATDSSFTTVG